SALPLSYTRRRIAVSRSSLHDRAVLILDGSPRRGDEAGGGGRIRTFEDRSRQIYSLLPLTARQPLRDRLPPAQRMAGIKVFDRFCQRLRPPRAPGSRIKRAGNSAAFPRGSSGLKLGHV